MRNHHCFPERRYERHDVEPKAWHRWLGADGSCRWRVRAQDASTRALLMDDVEAIKQLKGRYCRTMDTKDWAAMRQVFTDDVEMDTTASGGGVVTGADDFIEFLEATLGETITVHHGHMP